jgi:hypothetical protein
MPSPFASLRLRRKAEPWPERPAAKQHERDALTTVAAMT